MSSTSRSATLVVAAFVASLVASLLVGLHDPASALPIDGLEPPPLEDGEDPPEHVAPEDGFDWSVPSRFGKQDTKRRGIIDFHWTASDTYDPQHIYPSSFPADFDGCPDGDEAAASARNRTTFSYRWTVDGDEPTAWANRCTYRHHFPAQGTYEVTLEIDRSDDGDPPDIVSYTKPVEIRDLLIVSIGDSFASGEGNPDIAQKVSSGILGIPYIKDEDRAQWVDRRCHRSAAAGPAQAALTLEAADPKTSVTFLSFACSGGTIDRNYFGGLDILTNYLRWGTVLDPYAPGDPNKPVGSGILGAYRGVDYPNDWHGEDLENFKDEWSWAREAMLPSQIEQLEHAITTLPDGADGPREVDALLLSAGGNDMGFGMVAHVCLLASNCPDEARVWTSAGPVNLRTKVAGDIGALRARYDAMGAALRGLSDRGVTIAETLITEYPDLASANFVGDSGDDCPEILGEVIGMGFKMDQKEVNWARTSAFSGLNAQVEAAAARNGWTYVGGIAKDFKGHGYCASDNWIRTAHESVHMQGPKVGLFSGKDTLGTLHPTRSGHRAISRRILEQLTPLLYTDATTTPPAPPDTDFSLSTPGAREGDNGWLTGTCDGDGCSSDEVVAVVTATSDQPITASQIAVDGTAGCESATCTLVSTTTSRTWTLSLDTDGVHDIGVAIADPSGVVSTETFEVKVDLTDPTISVGVPTLGTQYTLGQVVNAGYECHDTGSGLASCEGPVPDGEPIDTGSIGSRNFVVEATDHAGRTATKVRSYRVVYGFGGFTGAVDGEALNVAKAGSAVPLTFSLDGDHGLGILDGAPTSGERSCGDEDTDDLNDVEPTTNPGASRLSYDAGTDTYTYVWKTDKKWTGTCRTLRLRLEDGTTKAARFRFR